MCSIRIGNDFFHDWDQKSFKKLQFFSGNVAYRQKTERGPFRIFNINFVAKYQKPRKAGPLDTIEIFRKSCTVPKQIERGLV